MDGFPSHAYIFLRLCCQPSRLEKASGKEKVNGYRGIVLGD